MDSQVHVDLAAPTARADSTSAALSARGEKLGINLREPVKLVQYRNPATTHTTPSTCYSRSPLRPSPPLLFHRCEPDSDDVAPPAPAINMVIAKPVRALLLVAFVISLVLFLQQLQTGPISLPTRGAKGPIRQGADGPDPNHERTFHLP